VEVKGQGQIVEVKVTAVCRGGEGIRIIVGAWKSILSFPVDLPLAPVLHYSHLPIHNDYYCYSFWKTWECDSFYV